jgi:hypothetical protein
MAKSTILIAVKRKRGRPALYEGSNGKGAPQIGLRLPPDDLAAVDAWIAKQKEPDLSRPEAIRRMVDLGLKGKWKMREIKSKNPLSEAVRREREEEWNS